MGDGNDGAQNMDRAKLLTGLWAMASGLWICLVLLSAAASAGQEAPRATFLLALAPPVLTIVAGLLIARVLRQPAEDSGRPSA